MEKKIGLVKEIFSADKNSSGLPRPIVKKLSLVEGFGIEHDKFAGSDLERVVMVIGDLSYRIAIENGIDLKNGSFGENILFDFDPHEFKAKDQFKIGNSIIEVTYKCTLCDHLSAFGSKLPKLIKNHRGLYCKIISGGEIEKEMIVSQIFA